MIAHEKEEQHMQILRRNISKISLLAYIFVAAAFLSLAFAGNVLAITNGQPDGGEHPYVGLAVFDTLNSDGAPVPAWRCSCSLLSPTVVLTAGHCTDGAVAARVWFDEIVQGNPEYPYGGTTSYEGTPYAYPGFAYYLAGGLPGFITGDVGIIVLEEPVTTISEKGLLPEAGYSDTLRNKSPVDQVGYGVQEQIRGGGPPSWTGIKQRLFAPAQIISGQFVHSDEFLRLTQNIGNGKGGTCFGDSGGPVLDAGTNTILAVTSYGSNGNCAGVGYYCRIDTEEILDWIESFM
jgi:V8-like Glu-specific endopeptidase